MHLVGITDETTRSIQVGEDSICIARFGANQARSLLSRRLSPYVRDCMLRARENLSHL